MIKVANIITDEPINNIPDTFTQDEYIDGLPTLYVGWYKVKKLRPEVSILEKEIESKKIFWTFSKSENREVYEVDLERFLRNASHYYFISKYTYIYIDPIFNDIKLVSDFLQFFNEGIQAFYVYKDSFIYLLSNKTIYGIDLDIVNMIMDEKQLLLDYLKSKCDRYIIDSDNEFLASQNKHFYHFKDLKRYLVTLI